MSGGDCRPGSVLPACKTMKVETLIHTMRKRPVKVQRCTFARNVLFLFVERNKTIKIMQIYSYHLVIDDYFHYPDMTKAI